MPNDLDFGNAGIEKGNSIERRQLSLGRKSGAWIGAVLSQGAACYIGIGHHVAYVNKSRIIWWSNRVAFRAAWADILDRCGLPPCHILHRQQVQFQFSSACTTLVKIYYSCVLFVSIWSSFRGSATKRKVHDKPS